MSSNEMEIEKGERSAPPPYEETAPLISESPKNYSTVQEYDKDKEFDQSEEHKLKDFQLIRVPQKAPIFSFRKLWAFTGPGFLMSIAYIDPGNIESDLQVGAVTQYKLLWVLLWSTVMGLILQLLSAKLGVVTGQHLAQVCRERYPKPARITLWLSMELAIIGSDIQEVIGSALAINILSQGTVPLWEGCLITGIDTFIFLFLESYGLRYLEAFFGMLIGVMCAMFGWMYIHTAIEADNQLEVFKGAVIPMCANCTSDAVVQGLGVVGAVIMPHNLFLHSGLVLSRAISRTDRVEIKEGIKYNYIESSVAVGISFFINMFIVCAFGAAIFGKGLPLGTPIDVQWACSPANISLLRAVDCLYYSNGMQDWIRYVWAVGLLAAGQSSTMTGTYAGQFVMEGFLDLKWAKWKRVLLTRSVAMVPCVIIAILAVNVLDSLSDYINVEQSLLLPFSLFPLLHATSSKEVMGEFKNSVVWSIVVWIMALVIIGVNIYFVIDVVALPGQWWRHLLVAIGLLIYLVVVSYFALFPLILWWWNKRKVAKEKTPEVIPKRDDSVQVN
ncbi:natural resistance-associated macrophage protein 2-like [Halichondria panicea]|uniref:natural resistance-associated macrophage protein 2-like n=1 Tax=Halichondria panicea TaxID=6063 RepID=UPI00312B9709